MHYLCNGTRRGRRGFTIVELLVVVVVLAVLAAIVLPKFMKESTRSREAALSSDLKLIRNAVSLFYTDTGCYPACLADLTRKTAPASGLNTAGESQTITAADWHGPYLNAIPDDPISGVPFSYGTTPPDVGKVTSSAAGNALDGTAYSSW